MSSFNELIEILNVNLGVRFTYQQKLRASKALYGLLHELTINVVEAKAKRTKLHNLVINDVNQAQVILMTSYDTPQRLGKDYRYFPFDKNQEISSRRQVFRKNLFLSLFFIVLSLVFLYLSTITYRTVMVILMGISLFLSFEIMRSRANVTNANRNNGSIAIALEMAKKYPSLGVVLPDQASELDLGYQFWNGALANMDKKIVIILDCVSGLGELVAQGNVQTQGIEITNNHHGLPFNRCIKVARVESDDYSVKNTGSKLDKQTPSLYESLNMVDALIKDLLNGE